MRRKVAENKPNGISFSGRKQQATSLIVQIFDEYVNKTQVGYSIFYAMTKEKRRIKENQHLQKCILSTD